MRTRSTILTVLVVASVSLGAVAGVSASGHLSIVGPSSSVETTPGSNVSVTYSVTNTNANATDAVVTIDDSSLPSSWTVTDVTGDDPNPQDQFAVVKSGLQIAFSDVDPNETVTVTANVSIPDNGSIGDQTLNATLEDGSGNTLGNAAATISVSNPLSIEAGGPFSVENGSSVDVQFTVTNDGSSTEKATVRLNNSTVPSSWTVTDVTGDDPNPQDEFAVIASGGEIAFSDIDPSETVTATVTVSVPANASTGDQSIEASLVQDGTTLGTSTATVTVEVFQNTTDKYDKDKDGIETTELLDAVKDLRDGKLDSIDLFEVIRSWRNR